MNKRAFLGSSFAAALGVVACADTGSPRQDPSRMVKLVFVMRRRPGMELDEFSRHWREVHGPIAATIPGLRKYVQNHVSESFDGSAPPFDGFTEFWFDDMESLGQGLSSPQSQAALADSENFVDLQSIRTIIVEEVDVV